MLDESIADGDRRQIYAQSAAIQYKNQKPKYLMLGVDAHKDWQAIAKMRPHLPGKFNLEIITPAVNGGSIPKDLVCVIDPSGQIEITEDTNSLHTAITLESKGLQYIIASTNTCNSIPRSTKNFLINLSESGCIAVDGLPDGIVQVICSLDL